MRGNGDFISIYLTFEYRSICAIPRADSSSPELQEEATGLREARTGEKLLSWNRLSAPGRARQERWKPPGRGKRKFSLSVQNLNKAAWDHTTSVFIKVGPTPHALKAGHPPPLIARGLLVFATRAASQKHVADTEPTRILFKLRAASIS